MLKSAGAEVKQFNIATFVRNDFPRRIGNVVGICSMGLPMEQAPMGFFLNVAPAIATRRFLTPCDIAKKSYNPPPCPAARPFAPGWNRLRDHLQRN